MYSLYKWQFDALQKGVMLAQLDERERLAELSANLRYTLYAKRVKPKKLFDRRKEEREITNLFTHGTPKEQQQNEFAERVAFVNDYFRNKDKERGEIDE